VSRVGNGAHIFAPKDWINEKVLVIRLEKKSVKEQILDALYPHLDKIIAVFIYGSYARGEASENSDIDVMIIAKESFKVESKENFEFKVVAESLILNAIEAYPILMYSVFKEAKPILNEAYLDKLRENKVNKKFFIYFLDETCGAIASNKEILDLDKKTGKMASNSVVYSLILRLRGVLIIKTLINNQEYSNCLFRKWVLNNCKVNYEKAYGAYSAIRDDRKGQKDEVSIEEAESLLKFLESELKKLVRIIKKSRNQ